MLNRRMWWFLLTLFSSTAWSAEQIPLQVQAVPKAGNFFDEELNMVYSSVFFDQGSWHGFLLPPDEVTDYHGAFPGPVIIAEEYAHPFSDALQRLKLIDAENDAIISFAEAKGQRRYLLGQLEQSYQFANFELNQLLIFVDDRTALVRNRFTAATNIAVQLKIGFSGKTFHRDWVETVIARPNGLDFNLKTIRQSSRLMLGGGVLVIRCSCAMQTSTASAGYESWVEGVQRLSKKQPLDIYYSIHYYHNRDEYNAAKQVNNQLFSSADRYFNDNQQRWNSYLANNRQQRQSLEMLHKKTVSTLISNWRSPAGAILHGAVTPSVSYKWFNGVWAWDSWKHAVALSHINPSLAKDSVLSMFDYQVTKDDTVRPQDEGMVIDTVFYNRDAQRGGEGYNWNERNSKPPLAAWAVWNIFQADGDSEFLKLMYPKLKSYHAWWYSNRDHNKKRFG